MDKKKERKLYKVKAFFDTETTNIKTENGNEAFPVLYITNTIKGNISTYEPNISDTFFLYRKVEDFIDYLETIIIMGKRGKYIPIIAAYNLGFDFQTISYILDKKYNLDAVAQSSTNFYLIDVYPKEIPEDPDDYEPVLRFWDTFHLCRRGLACMGDIAGLPKANGDWDYTKIRNLETPLTPEEEFYAKRDTQVIPAYLKYILDTYEYIFEDDLGTKCLTSTSLVRLFAKRVIGEEDVYNSKYTLETQYRAICGKNKAKSFESYALRKACFRGGFTFTAGKNANKVVKNVASVDVTSMHHTYITGRYIPVDFKKVNKPSIMNIVIKTILDTKLEDVLHNYEQPFSYAFHARIKFNNIRLKENSVFGRNGIALIPKGKFVKILDINPSYSNKGNIKLYENIRNTRFQDTAENPEFAFSKLYSADTAILNINEIELWNIGQVYDFDSFEFIEGEYTQNFREPPAYVTLQTCYLFEQKSQMKKIVYNYKEGTPYQLEIPDFIPTKMAERMKKGTASEYEINAYYNGTIKGMYNGIYGTQAQDVYRPEHRVINGDFEIDENTLPSIKNFSEKNKGSNSVLYTYGMRIVGGSRQHLVISMLLLDKHLKSRARLTGGDTDSMKIALDDTVSNEELKEALSEIGEACTKAINRVMKNTRKRYPKYASQLKGLGHFDIENCGNSDRYVLHFEAWNKTRMSIDTDGKCHITAAGVPRPHNAYTLETVVEDLMCKGYSFTEIAPVVLGYDTYLDNSVCHLLQKSHPDAMKIFDGDVTDYLGNTSHVNTFSAVALYPGSKMLGCSQYESNYENIKYLKKNGQNINTKMHTISHLNNTLKITETNIYGNTEIFL